MPSHYNNGKMSGEKKNGNGNGAKKNVTKKGGGKGTKEMKDKMSKLRAMRGKK